jgi:branched-chain amino acid transport system ATP-binding protein
MLAIGRALMSRPRLLLLDEPSMGLAPLLVERIMEAVASLRRDAGVTVLLVEQNAVAALAIADRGYVIETGRIGRTGTGAELLRDPAVREAYLGL